MNCKFHLLISIFYLFHSNTNQSILNRETLAEWIPNFNSTSKLVLFAKQITSISPQTFVQLINVKELYLNQNQMLFLTSYIYDGLSQLEHLGLNQNQLSHIDNGAILSGLNNLKYLNLQGNQLVKLASASFLNVPNLIWLDVSFNRLNTLDSFTFASLSQLNVLILSENLLTLITDGTLSYLSKLNTLYLDSNQIITFDLKGMRNLTEFYVQNNLLANLTQTQLNENICLVQINFENNKIDLIDNNIFSGLSMLQAVYFASNPISVKQPDYVKQLCTKIQNPLCKIYV